MSTLGPSLGDVYEDLIASDEVAEPGRYTYEMVDGRLYAVGEFGRARVSVTLEAVAP